MPLVIELVGLFDHAVQTIVDASGGVVDRVDSAVPRFARADVRFRAKLGVGGAMIFECIGDYREFPPLVAPRRRVVLRGYVSLSAKYPRTDRSRRERSTVSKLLHWIPGRQRTIWHIAILDKCIKTRSRSQPIFLCHALRTSVSPSRESPKSAKWTRLFGKHRKLFQGYATQQVGQYAIDRSKCRDGLSIPVPPLVC